MKIENELLLSTEDSLPVNMWEAILKYRLVPWLHKHLLCVYFMVIT